jgi:hypothetical protein
MPPRQRAEIKSSAPHRKPNLFNGVLGGEVRCEYPLQYPCGSKQTGRNPPISVSSVEHRYVRFLADGRVTRATEMGAEPTLGRVSEYPLPGLGIPMLHHRFAAGQNPPCHPAVHAADRTGSHSSRPVVVAGAAARRGSEGPTARSAGVSSPGAEAALTSSD